MAVKFLFSFFILLFLHTNIFSQSDRELIEETLNDFINGTEYNYPEKIESAFYPEADMYLFNHADTLMRLSPKAYAAFYDNGRRGQRNKRYSKVITLEVVLNVAYAKLEVEIPSYGNRYYDLMLLKKIEGKWLIVSKCTSAEPIPKTALELKSNPEKEIIMEGLKKPWSMTFIDENQVLITEKDGDLLKINVKTKERDVISGLPNDIARAIQIDTSMHPWGVYPSSADGTVQSYNAGWFQVLLDSDFENNHWIYISYASMNESKESALKVVRGKLVDNNLTQIEILLFAGPYSHGLFHYGGGMTFGADGKLYIATGERNLFEHHNPALPLAQDITDKRGKIFRLNSDGSIPGDNPDFGPNALPGLYAIGIRATQGLILNKVTSDIWFTDHGTIQGDELNLLSAGANYGWPYKTSGKYRSKDYNPNYSNEMAFLDPVYYWSQTIAPTGLAIYHGNEFPQWADNILVPGLSKGSLWRIEMYDERVQSMEELFIGDRVRLRKVVVSPRGKIYLLTDEENGKIIQVVNRLEK